MAREAPADAGKTLSPAQIAWFAQQAGFTGGDLTTATAIALAESGGRTAAIGGPNSNGSKDYGLWQINDRAHPDKITADAQWWVAGYNAQWAYKIYQQAGNKFTPWSTFNSGAYLRFTLTAMNAAKNPESSGLIEAGENTVITTNPISDLVAPFKAIAGAVFKTAAWVANPKNGIRTAQIFVGGTLVVGALVIVARPYIMGAAAPVINTAADIAPGGGALRKAARVAAKGAKK